MQQFLREAFDNFDASHPTNTQLLALQQYGATRVYYYLSDDVTIHKTLPSKEVSDDVDTQTENGTYIGFNIMTRREKLAMTEISKFKTSHPGMNCVLIFGAMHEFEDDFMEQNLQGRLVEVTWFK